MSGAGVIEKGGGEGARGVDMTAIARSSLRQCAFENEGPPPGNVQMEVSKHCILSVSGGHHDGVRIEGCWLCAACADKQLCWFACRSVKIQQALCDLVPGCELKRQSEQAVQ